MTDATTEIITGDCIDEMGELDDNSVHAVVTDPPYNFEGGFMGEEWDNIGSSKEYQEWCESWASEALRVVKPGGHLIAFSGSRTEHRLKSGVEDAGFEIRDTITWHYSTGMPKGKDIGKCIDERGGDTANIPNLPEMITEAREDAGLSRTEVAEHLAEADEEATGAIWNWEKGYRTPSPDSLNKLIELIDLPLERVEAADRMAVGYNDRAEGWFTQGDGHEETIAKTELAQQWEGWKPSLKPATEFAVLARKPLSETSAYKNVLKHGTGALNIAAAELQGEDRCRHPPNVAVAEGTTNIPERYFYTSKASERERTVNGQVDNDHMTVKPLDLMEWLVTLVTAPGQRVLDPFAGSGTTIMACKRLNRESIGIELDEEQSTIARKRVERAHEIELSVERRVGDGNGQANLMAFADGGGE